MAGVNKVILVGNLGADPEVRYTAGGTAVAKFSLATSRKFTGRDGQKQEKTEWHRIVAWGKLAEICGQYLSKGRQVVIEGRIEYGSYEKDGVKHYTTDIIAENMHMLGGGRGPEREPEPPFEPPGGGAPEDDIPF
jgi:single-strand DNA-binding protein